MGDLLALFGAQGFDASAHSEKARPVESPERQLIAAMRDHGLEPGTIFFDGAIHRFGGKKRNAWYIAFDGDLPGAAFGDWASGLSESWHMDSGRELSAADLQAHRDRVAAAKLERDRAREAEADAAAINAEGLWNISTEAAGSGHDYLVRKQIDGAGARISPDGSLVVPIYSQDGEIASVQTITAEGEKRFTRGAKIAGCFGFVGERGKDLFICEGFADAKTITDATGGGCFIAFSAHNLPAVAEAVADMGLHFTLVADNGETGQKYAARAVEETGCKMVCPPAGSGGKDDINDFACAGGNVSELLGAGRSWLVSYQDAIRQPSPVRWLIRGAIPRRALAMVYGPSGLGKTFFVLDMALHIASGLQWQGHRTHQEPVAYLAGEGFAGLASRLAAWEQERGNGNTLMHLSRNGAKLDTAAGLNFAIRELHKLPSPPRLIIVDTLHRFLSGDENKAQDAGAMVAACDKLGEEFGATVLLVHHTGLNGDRARGSSAWIGDLDSQIGLSSDDGEIITAEVHKLKDGSNGGKWHGTLGKVQLPWVDEDGETVTTRIWEPCEAPADAGPKALEIEMDHLRRAWATGGQEVTPDGQAPYISDAVLERWLLSEMRKTEGQARREMDPMKSGLIGKLSSNGVIRSESGGWVVALDPVVSTWMVIRGES